MKHCLHFLALLTSAILLTTFARAQSIPDLPCCIDFDDPDTAMDGVSGSYVSDLGIRYPGPSGLPSDGYLHAHDASGASWARLKPPGNGQPHCFGDWKGLLRPGKCVELCWDVLLETDGDNTQSIAKPARITIWSGGLRATFVTSTNIIEQGGPNNGWYSFCAPIALSNPDGTLPSNDQGYWVLPNDSDGNPLPASEWDKLLCNVDQIAFFVDYHSYQSEEWGWDNVCLRETDCDDCMRVSKGTWDCELDSTGNRILKYTFDVTNLSAYTAHVAGIPDPATFDIEPNTLNFTPPLDPGDTQSVTLCFKGAIPGSLECFEFVLYNLQEGECCRTEICVKIPCVKIAEEQIDCIPATTGADYSFTLTNISGAPAEYAYLVAKDPGVSFTPSLIPLGGLADGASINVGPIHINGATPNAELRFCVILLDKELHQCCFTEHCLLMPDCEFAPVEPGDNGHQTHPCVPDPANSAHVVTVSPDDCFSLCDEKIICDPENPGCYTYAFTITNLSDCVMSHLLLPDPNITPNSVIFPTPLNPGEAARVTVKINGAAPGSYTVPMVLVSLDQCKCCHFDHVIELEGCDCLVVLKERLECEGRDPITGLFCYNYCATIQNLTGEVIEHVFLFNNPGSVHTFTPDHFPTGGLPHLGTFTFNTTVKIPSGTPSIGFHISLHNADFKECCSVERRLEVPDCCDCEETINFEFDSADPGSTELPESVTLINLVRDPETGKIGFGSDITPFPFVYMACSVRGTIVRIDADTGAILGEYRTVPETRTSPSPSRTTVDKFGECWVGNRSDSLVVGAAPGRGSVMRVGLALGGTRGDRLGAGPYTFVPNPTGEYLQGPFTYLSPSVVDRDGDGFIRTSSGLANILDWDNAATSGNDSGGVSLSDDECIVNFVRVTERYVRAMAIDTNNDLWAGGTGGSIYQRVDGSTGIANITRTVDGGYGALIDGNDVLWSVKPGVGLERHDILANTTTSHPAPGCYGISINPCDGHIWLSSISASTEPSFGLTLQPILRRFDPTGTLVGACGQPNGAQGLCVDQTGDVWVSQAFGSNIWRFDNTCTLIATISTGITGSTGVAVDHNGKIWASDYIADAALRIDPTGPAIDLTSSLGATAGPYNYSDMTGFVALGAAGQTGSMLFTHDSLCPDTDWGRVTWATIGEVSKSCTIRAEVRASNDPLNYPATWTPVSSGASFCNGVAGSLPITGQYIQVRLIFERKNACDPDCNPQLCWLTVECCDVFGVGPANDPPVIEIGDPIVDLDGSLPKPIVVGANIIDPNGDRLQATWSSGGQTLAVQHFDGEGNSELSLDFPDGITELTLTVSDGPNTTTASTSVTIGDHLPPVVHCHQDEYAGGDVRFKAFTATIPNFLGSFTATDNVTPSNQLAIQQSPPAGTIVGQGSHPVTLSVGDAAGNVGRCTIYVIVEPVVKITSFSNYSAFETGESIPVGVTLQVPESEIARTEILVDGIVIRTIDGPLLAPMNLDLPVGHHTITVIVTDHNGNTSVPRARLVRVDDPDPNGFFPDRGITAHWEDEDRDVLILTFGTPDGLDCQLQRSDDLKDQWQTIHQLTGTGSDIDYRFEIPANLNVERAYFRVLYTK